MKKYLPFLIIYGVASPVLFIVAFLILPGFPFFPNEVLTTTDQNARIELKTGGYVILYFVGGTKPAPDTGGAIGTCELFKVESGTNTPIPSVAEDYSFDDAPNDRGNRGRAVCGFYIPEKQTVIVNSHFRKFGYDGLIVRTSLEPMLIAILGYELATLGVSGGVGWVFLRRLKR